MAASVVIQEDDAGMYHCEAVNVAGRQRKYFRLKVLVIPTISGPKFTRLQHGMVWPKFLSTCYCNLIFCGFIISPYNHRVQHCKSTPHKNNRLYLCFHTLVQKQSMLANERNCRSSIFYRSSVASFCPVFMTEQGSGSVKFVIKKTIINWPPHCIGPIIRFLPQLSATESTWRVILMVSPVPTSRGRKTVGRFLVLPIFCRMIECLI